MKPVIRDAVQSLTTQGFGWDFGEDCIIWPDTNTGEPPTRVEIDAKLIELNAEYDAQEYARNRATAFPSIGDQLDMQYHDQLDGTTTWKDAVAKVKSDNPKE